LGTTATAAGAAALLECLTLLFKAGHPLQLEVPPVPSHRPSPGQVPVQSLVADEEASAVVGRGDGDAVCSRCIDAGLWLPEGLRSDGLMVDI